MHEEQRKWFCRPHIHGLFYQCATSGLLANYDLVVFDYDIGIYRYRLRYRSSVLMTMISWFSRYRVFHDIVKHRDNIVKYTIVWNTISCFSSSRWRETRYRVFHDGVKHDIVIHDGVNHDIVKYTISWNTISYLISAYTDTSGIVNSCMNWVHTGTYWYVPCYSIILT